SIASAIRPKASRFSRYSVIAKITRVQIISPGLTRIRKSPSDAKGSAGIASVLLGDEEGDERHQQGVERDRLREGQAQEHQAQAPQDQGVAAELAPPGAALDGLADQVAHAGAGADRAEAGAETERERLRGVSNVAIDCH